MSDRDRAQEEVYHLEQVHVTCGDPGIPTATVELIAPDGEHLIDAAHGDGPVDAVYMAISRIVRRPGRTRRVRRQGGHQGHRRPG